ncbi:hypothetical protein NFI96_006204 [Prochilodus magdalenae]|nr:hypothetical protein NFI96_006204 [Prochilodus magdalenae]
MNGVTALTRSQVLAERSKAKKRKIAETSNVITETLPSAETETVEIEVEVGDDSIEVQEGGLEEVVDAGRANTEYGRTAHSSNQTHSVDGTGHRHGAASADATAASLALLADITSNSNGSQVAIRDTSPRALGDRRARGGPVRAQEGGHAPNLRGPPNKPGGTEPSRVWWRSRSPSWTQACSRVR